MAKRDRNENRPKDNTAIIILYNVCHVTINYIYICINVCYTTGIQIRYSVFVSIICYRYAYVPTYTILRETVV